jgi:hypothetical protein
MCVWYPLRPNYISVFLFLPTSTSLQATKLSHFFHLNSIILRSFTQHKLVSRLVLMCLLWLFLRLSIFYVCLSLSLSFLSNYTLVPSFTRLLIQYYTVPLSSPINSSNSCYFLPFVILFCRIFCIQTRNPVNTFTYSMVQSPSWAANWFAASQEIPRISRNPKVHYRTHKRLPPISILGQPNPVHIPTSHLLEIRPNIILPSTPRFPQRSLSLWFPHQDPIPPVLTHTRHMPSPSHSSRFYHPHIIGPVSTQWRKIWKVRQTLIGGMG